MGSVEAAFGIEKNKDVKLKFKGVDQDDFLAQPQHLPVVYAD